jgi:hypothetical protein
MERMKQQKVPITQRLDAIERKLQAGDIDAESALLLAYSEGFSDGRSAEPAVVKVGDQHKPEVQS